MPSKGRLMSRRKTRTGGVGIFDFTRDGVQAAEIRDNPLRRECRYCRAGIGERCTRPTRRGRVPIHGYHATRTERTQS